MKFLKLLLFVIVVLTGLTSCSKKSGDDGPSSPASIQGVWHGSVVTDATKVTGFYAFNFKAGGALDRLDEKGDIVGTGTWSLENNILSGKYKNAAGTTLSLMGAYNSSAKKILGNWGYGGSVSNGGTYELKQK